MNVSVCEGTILERSNPLSLYVEQSGNLDAPTCLLFLHGGGVSSWMWDKQVTHFKHYHCITIDLPEHGKSQSGIKFTIDGAAKSILQTIDHLVHNKSMVVIGFSLGAQVLIQMLHLQPNLINFAIINSALVKPVSNAEKLLNPMIRFSYPFIQKRWFAKIQAKTLYINDQYFEKYYEESRNITQNTLIRVLSENMSFSIPHGFSNVSTKILVTYGEKEKKLIKESAKLLVASNLNCQGIMIPKIGHGAPIAIPEYFNSMIENWLTKNQLPYQSETLIKL